MRQKLSFEKLKSELYQIKVQLCTCWLTLRGQNIGKYLTMEQRN
ncbi:hypothetical protein HMPREF9999_00806 [Alloprevotella sp. oral taxon 473 str. F0040]|nr:hypothetical protein HMPREF9999_00806 [Alloprevotella sp. oral taxon 473 str. F0040]